MIVHYYTLRSHDQEVTQSGQLYKCLRESLMTDSVIIADGKGIRVHKIILASASPFFMRVFSQKQKSQDSGVLEIGGISFEEMNWLVTYIYTGSISSLSAYQVLRFVELCKQCEIKVTLHNIVGQEDREIPSNELLRVSNANGTVGESMDMSELNYFVEPASNETSTEDEPMAMIEVPRILPVVENSMLPPANRSHLIQKSKFTGMKPTTQAVESNDHEMSNAVAPHQIQASVPLLPVQQQHLSEASSSYLNTQRQLPVTREKPAGFIESLVQKFCRKRKREKTMKPEDLPASKKRLTDNVKEALSCVPVEILKSPENAAEIRPSKYRQNWVVPLKKPSYCRRIFQ